MRGVALDLFEAALAAVEPGAAVRRHLRVEGRDLRADGLRFSLDGGGVVRLLAFGKASLAMARAALELVPVKEGLLVTPQAETSVGRLRVLKAGHPRPDEGSLEAGEIALDLAGRNGPKDLLLVLLSGGGSSLLESTTLSLESLQRATSVLLRSGMDITAMNTVRSHLSNLKGGRLGVRATQRGGRVLTLAISDVVGDSPPSIGSGPTVADPTTFADAEGALRAHGIWEAFPSEARACIEQGVAGRREETPKPGEPGLDRSTFLLVASNTDACEAARTEAIREGYQATVLTNHLRGQAADAGRALARMADAVATGRSFSPPAAFIAGGETTVKVRGTGVGGRNQELALATVPILHQRQAVLLSCGTDGRDGETDAAGALVDGDTLARAARLNLDSGDYLARNDSHTYFRTLGDAVVTGATGTNVMDIAILLFGAESAIAK